MRAEVDSSASTMRPFTLSFARSSSSALTGSSRIRSSSPASTSQTSTRFSGRVPTYSPIWPVCL